MGRFVGYAVPLVALLAVSACGASSAGDPGEQRYRHTGMVLENEKHGPQLCAIVESSDPPGCGGPDVVGWDWSKVTSEARLGSRWGEYTLVGTYDGERFTLTEPAKPAPEIVEEPYRASIPCDEPAGGWRPVDDSKATEGAAGRAMNRAMSAPEFAGRSIAHPGGDGLDPDDPDFQRLAGDPKWYVLHLSFTGDLAGREAWIREVWGGALCISSARYTDRELRKIQTELTDRTDFISVGADEHNSRVELQVYRATDELQAELDREYGKGTVKLDGWLQPVQ